MLLHGSYDTSDPVPTKGERIADDQLTAVLPMPDEPAPWTDVAGMAFDDAKRLFKESDFATALERHEWFHEHALEVNSSYYGVRLSFALRHWRKLADVYPPAMISLVAIRDRDTQQLLDGNGPPQLLHDVDSINNALEESDATLVLFRCLEEIHPALAKEAFVFVDQLCLDADRALFRRFCNDPVKFFRQHLQCYLGSAVFLSEQGQEDSDTFTLLRSELAQLASRLAEVYSDSGETVSKIARLESTIDDALARRLL